MTHFFKTFIFSILVSLCFFSTITAEQNPHLNYSLKEDGRDWKVGYESSNKEQAIIEYIVGDETVNNWKELVSIQYFNGLNVKPEPFYQGFIKQLRNAVPQNKVQDHIINQDDNSIFAEWWINDKSPFDQHEWIRIFVDGDDLAVFRYTTKNNDKVDAARKTWEKIISDVKFVRDPVTTPAPATPEAPK